MIQLLLKTNAPGNETPEANYSFVSIDPAARLDTRRQLQAVLEIPGLYCVTFFDSTPIPVCVSEDGRLHQPNLAQQPRDLQLPITWFHEANEVNIVPEDYEQIFAESQVCGRDSSTIRYKPDGIMWHFYRKHSGEVYETETIPWELLEEAVESHAA